MRRFRDPGVYATLVAYPILNDVLGGPMKALLDLGIIFTVTGVISTVWALLARSGHLPEAATKNHPSARVGLIIGIVLIVVGVVLLVVRLA